MTQDLSEARKGVFKKNQSLHPKLDSGLNPESSFVVFGMDEVGAGCLAGPVVAGCFAYALTSAWCDHPLPVRVFDSKKLSDSKRLSTYQHLSSGALEGVAHSIVEVSSDRIDEINILWARMEAMWKAFVEAHAKMSEILGTPHFLWRAFVDGNRLPKEALLWNSILPISDSGFVSQMPKMPFKTVIKGDSVVFAIAAASILAKEYRDRLMAELGSLPAYESYNWAKNVGYPTPDHKEAIRKKGYSDLHRKSFSANL